MSELTGVAAAGPLPKGTPWLRLDNRFLPPLLITSILLAAHLSFGILEGWERTALAIVTAFATEMVLGRVTYGKWPYAASAYITGISVGILLRSPFLWPYALCAFISIASKYVLRFRGRHLWNPSNLGVSLILFLAPETVSLLSVQWGNVVVGFAGSAASALPPAIRPAAISAVLRTVWMRCFMSAPCVRPRREGRDR